MRRKKFLIEQEILSSLIFNGPLKLSNIACIVRTNCNKMKILLKELNQEGLVTQKKLSKDILYLITSKGLELHKKISLDKRLD